MDAVIHKDIHFICVATQLYKFITQSLIEELENRIELLET